MIATRLFAPAACVFALIGAGIAAQAAAPTAADLAKAIESGDFAAYQTSADAWLAERSAGAADQAALLERIADPGFRLVLDQRALIAACGADKLGAFAKADASNRAVLGWLLADTAALDLLLEGAVPLQLAARDRNELRLSVGTLEILARIVAADARSPRDGRFLEIVGIYDPRQEPSLIRIDQERALHWLRHGAQPTERVEKLLKISGAWDEFQSSKAGG